MPGEKEPLRELIFTQRKLNKGPAVVVIGGGTGLSVLLRGIKHITGNCTAVVTTGDDGGSSGRLRKEMGMVPPGDMLDIGKEISMEPVIGTDEPYVLTEGDLPRIMEEYDKLARIYLDRRANGEAFDFFHFNVALDNGPCVAKRLAGCGAGHDQVEAQVKLRGGPNR